MDTYLTEIMENVLNKLTANTDSFHLLLVITLSEYRKYNIKV